MHKVVKMDMHPKWDKFMYDYDAAILTLQTTIHFDSTRQPTKLPYLNEAILEGTLVSTSGWGATNNPDELNTVLRMVQLRIINQVQCFISYKNQGGITTRMVCATAPNKDSCYGGLLGFFKWMFKK